MEEGEFKKLIKKERYQVFLFQSKITLPLSFFVHYWFVISEKGKVSRYEVHFRDVNHEKEKKFGHLYIDLFYPTRGQEIIRLFTHGPLWKGRMKSYIEGGKNSTAKKMIDSIKKSKENYPFRYKYKLFPGPNSNTYIQWIINKFPESKFSLSWRALGKNYKFS